MLGIYTFKNDGSLRAGDGYGEAVREAMDKGVNAVRAFGANIMLLSELVRATKGRQAATVTELSLFDRAWEQMPQDGANLEALELGMQDVRNLQERLSDNVPVTAGRSLGNE